MAFPSIMHFIPSNYKKNSCKLGKAHENCRTNVVEKIGNHDMIHINRKFDTQHAPKNNSLSTFVILTP